MKPWVIYVLADPRSPDKIRYVGKTTKSLRIRLTGHLHYARSTSRKSHLVSWLNALVLEGVEPLITVVDQGPGEADWEAAERHWIAWHRAQGSRLCNSTDGGEGATPGYKMSPEAKVRLSAANKGRKPSAETRAKMSTAKKGRKPVGVTLESYRKMALTKTGRQGPKQTPEQVAHRVALVKATWAQKKAEGRMPPPSRMSAEGRARMAEAHRKPRSEEIKAKISAAKKGQGLGRKLSLETRARMSAAQKARHEVRDVL